LTGTSKKHQLSFAESCLDMVEREGTSVRQELRASSISAAQHWYRHD
jgi:hypothetical protein